MRRIVELDGIRAFAVGAVILDHYAPFRNFAWSAPARFGGIGVDVFFVLSGFLITSILLRAKSETHPYRVFYARRSVRILPPLLLLLVVVSLAALLLRESLSWQVCVAQLLFLRSFKGSGATLLHAATTLRHPLHLPNLFAYRPPSILPRDYARLPMSASLGPTWSLSVEEWFYVLWAPVVLLLRRRHILFVSSAFCVLGLFFRWVSLGATNFLTSFDVLVVGALLALWIEHRATLSHAQVARFDRYIRSATALAVSLWLLLTFLRRDLVSITLLEISLFGGFCWLLHRSGSDTPIARLLRLRSLVYIGSISYTIYLIHLPAYFVLRHFFDRHGSHLSYPGRVWLTALSSICATVMFAIASWRFYERPILERKELLTQLLKRDTMPGIYAHRGPITAGATDSNISS